VLAADVDTADGVIPTLALVDEMHRHKSAGLYGVFRDGLGARDGQMLTISTAGDNEAARSV
jgi:phage terminase large subunit-like protein